MKAPSSSLDYERWAREQVPVRKLTRGQAQILTLLASYADRRGECFPSVRALADRAVLSERHTDRLLGELRSLGLVESVRRGRDRTARRRLCPHAPLPAPPAPCGTMPLFDAMLAPTFDSPAAPVAADPPSEVSDPPSDGAEKEQTRKETAVCENAPAHDSGRAVQSPSLTAVMEVLEQAGDSGYVEAAHIDIVLRTFPHADHLEAAGYVLLQLLQPDCRCRTASLLLHTQLKRNDRQRRTPLPGAPHGGRRRAAPAQPAKLSPEGRRWGPIAGNKYDRAAGLTP